MDIQAPTSSKKRSLENDDYENNSNSKHARVNGESMVESKLKETNSSVLDNLSFPADESLRKCPFLDTVNRQVLDFDMDKVCSVTLSNHNVYACLVCGLFFQGRGKNTPAYTHSVQCGHFVFMNLNKQSKVYCLPDNYEVIDSTLDDIKQCLHPCFSSTYIESIDSTNTKLNRDIFGVLYLPGFIGLNNLNATDFINVVVHAFAHITPIRDIFLAANENIGENPVVQSLAEIVRKIWSPHNFKSVVSPQEFVHAVSVASKKKYAAGKQMEVVDFLMWILEELRNAFTGELKNVLDDVFRGQMEVYNSVTRKSSLSSFTTLSLDIPPVPLFKDSEGGLVIPQVSIFDILKKFDGSTVSGDSTFALKRLPKYLILHFKRFEKNNFYVDKNITIITFPVRNLDLKDLIYPNGVSPVSNLPSKGDLDEKSVKELREFVLMHGAEKHKVQLNQIVEKGDLSLLAGEVVEHFRLELSTKYDLVCNICHDSQNSQSKAFDEVFNNRKNKGGNVNIQASMGDVLGEGKFRIQICNKVTNQWFQVQDLYVTEISPQTIGLSESYILIYEKKIVN